ncbi:MAG: hypothetical protein ACO3SO_00365 [Luteolibacter sp.]
MSRLPGMLGILALSLPLTLQGEQKRAEVEFRAARFDPKDRPSPEYLVGPEGDQIEVEVPLTYIAGPHKARLREGGFLDFWQGGEEPKLSVRIAPDELKDLLLFFIPSQQDYIVVKVKTGGGRIRGGDRYVANATNRALAFKLGDGQPLVVKPGEAGLLKGPGGQDPVSVPALVSMKKDEGWKLACTEQWLCDPRFRRYVFAYISPRTKQLVFHSLSERLQRP